MRAFVSYFDSQGILTEPTAFDGRSDYKPFQDNGIAAGGLFSGALLHLGPLSAGRSERDEPDHGKAAQGSATHCCSQDAHRMVASRAPPAEHAGSTESASFSCVTNDELAAFYRRYNECCNEHRFGDLAEFVARDVAIDGTDRGLDAYAAELRAVVRAFPDYRWELRRLVVEAPWIAAHFTDTGTHREAFLGVQATGRLVAVPEFAFYRVDAGQIAEVWGSAFHVHLLEQLR